MYMAPVNLHALFAVDIGWEKPRYTTGDSVMNVSVCGIVYRTITRRNVTVHVESVLLGR